MSDLALLELPSWLRLPFFIIGLVQLLMPIITAFVPIARLREIVRKKITLPLWAVFIVIYIGCYFVLIFYNYDLKQRSANVLPWKDEAANDFVQNEKTVWVRVSEEAGTRGVWDTSDLKFASDKNAFCTRSKEYDFFTIWNLVPRKFTTSKLHVKFNVMDNRVEKDGPLYFLLSTRAQNPTSGLYDLPIASFSVPVDEVTNRVEFKKYNRETKKLEYEDHPGNLQSPILLNSQTEISFEPVARDNYLSYVFTVDYYPFDDGNHFPLTKPFTYSIEDMPFLNFNGVMFQFGFGITVGGCIRDVQYLFE